LECHREIESGREDTQKKGGQFECQIIEGKCFEYEVLYIFELYLFIYVNKHVSEMYNKLKILLF